MNAKSSIENGNNFPLDINNGIAVDKAHETARGIMWSLCGLRGIDSIFDEIDDEIKCDIVNEVAEIIRFNHG